MKRLLMSMAILLFLCGASHATIIFSDDFESGNLDQWTGKDDGSHFGIIDTDPINNSNKALTFSEVAVGGDMFTNSSFAAGSYWLSFDYLGKSQDEDSGGYVGISQNFSPQAGTHEWLWATGDAAEDDPLIDDGEWHSYTFAFTSGWGFHLMLEDFEQAGNGKAGDAWFDNFSLSDTAPVPEPATILLLSLGLLGLAGVSRRQK